MARCDHCGAECALPFTCQHCGGKFCPDCRLPPGHNCTGMERWNKRPRPSVSLRYGGGGVSVTGGGYMPSRAETKKKTPAGVPYLWIMAAILVIILIGLAWLEVSGFRPG